VIHRRFQFAPSASIAEALSAQTKSGDESPHSKKTMHRLHFGQIATPRALEGTG